MAKKESVMIGPFGTPVSVHVEEVIERIDVLLRMQLNEPGEQDELILRTLVWAQVLGELDNHQKAELLWLKLRELIKARIEELKAA